MCIRDRHEDGHEKKVTESYVVEALSFGEAEKTAIEFLGGYVSGEIQVVNINPMKFREVFFNEQESCDRYYKAILQFITINEQADVYKRQHYTDMNEGTNLMKKVRTLALQRGGIVMVEAPELEVLHDADG